MPLSRSVRVEGQRHFWIVQNIAMNRTERCAMLVLKNISIPNSCSCWRVVPSCGTLRNPNEGRQMETVRRIRMRSGNNRDHDTQRPSSLFPRLPRKLTTQTWHLKTSVSVLKRSIRREIWNRAVGLQGDISQKITSKAKLMHHSTKIYWYVEV